MKLNELVNNPTYDLKDGYFAGETKIEQFLNYKHDNKGYDFDAYKEVVEMYREAFVPFMECEIHPKSDVKQFHLNCHHDKYTGETMNSGGYILKSSLQLSEGYWEKCAELGVKGSFSNNYGLFFKNIDKFTIEADINRLNKYLGLTHSIGNFIPVPEYFNVGRNLPTSDYWDLTMYNIYLWYKTKDDEYLIRFLTEIRDNSRVYAEGKRILDFAKPWLLKLESWQNFVKLNYLEPFVDKNMKPIPFWDDHFERFEKKQGLSPQSINEVNQFLETVTKMIVERGNLISSFMKEKIDK